MALRTIRVQGDSVLTKKSRTVDKMTPRIGELITDMLDTMYDAMGWPRCTTGRNPETYRCYRCR